MGYVQRVRDAVARGMVRAGAAMAVEYKPWDDFWYGPVGEATDAGIRVTPDKAMRSSVINACIRIWSGCIGMLPLQTFERTGPESRREATESAAWKLLMETPNEYQTPMEFKQELIAHMAARGNAYVEKIPGARGAVDRLWPIHPDYVVPDWLNRKSGRRKVYNISSGHDGRARVLSQDRVWHPKLLSLDGGLTGASPIQLAANGIGLHLQSQRMVSRFFVNGARPSGILTGDAPIKQTTRKELREEWDKIHRGAWNMQKTAVLGHGLSYKAISVTPKDAALVELLNWSVADQARAYGVPLWLLQHEEKDTAWGTGMEQMAIGLVVYTFSPVIVAVEESAGANLLDSQRRMFMEFMVDALMRGDTKTRWEMFKLAREMAVFSADDIRAKQNMNPRPDGLGGRYWRPANMVVDDDTEPQEPTNGQRGQIVNEPGNGEVQPNA